MDNTGEWIKKKWGVVLRISLFLTLWEVSYYLGFMDAIHFSHPKAIVHTLLGSTFLQGFALMTAQLACASVMGGASGVVLGKLLIRSARLAQAVIQFLRVGLWFPFLIAWAIPISYSGYRSSTALTIWTLVVCIIAVTLSTCFHYLSALFILQLKFADVRLEIVRMSILQALFVSLISQVWLVPFGWNVFRLGAEYIERIYAAAILLSVFLVLVNDLCRYDFAQTSEAHCEIIRRTLSSENTKSYIDTWLIVVFLTVLWELFSLSALDPFISSPLAILQGGYYLIFNYWYTQAEFPSDIIVSLAEVLGGLILAAGAALIVFKAESSVSPIESYILPFLPLTYILPILFPLGLIGWFGYVDFWWTMLGIASVCFFAYMEVFTGLRSCPRLCRILIATDHALPFAFVMMIFGEAMSASAGLGFLMIVARATQSFQKGLGAALIIVVFFVILSSILRFAAKRIHFSSESSLPLTQRT